MPTFRTSCGSGNAFVHHEQAVLSEIFDACTMSGDKTALGGFLALSPSLRRSFHAGLNMLIASQFAQVFGARFEQGELHYQDWATEFFTCASRDRRETQRAEHPQRCDPLLRESQWNGKLFFAASETADTGAGYLEGALDAAMRTERMLLAANRLEVDRPTLNDAAARTTHLELDR
jgi:monoamine oxidase